ncbi:MAG: hypothetical protein EZS28_012985 [Streblomastix strix]|uniref:B30.2/SPRY domain-containing protein n=1 Tax=Streblomastix strix TaxID=222440 RepID=A0A5J4W9A0_9EUKA|nr:MAG: hypothetical protein EZS28_012985 [Streblomastix strix]
MAFPKDYNVIGGLLGLGEYILLEILSELILIPNAVQFLGIILLKSSTKILMILNLQIFIFIKRQIRKKYGDNTISLVHILQNGIWSLELMFQNMGGYGAAIGIVRDSYGIPANADFEYNPHTDHIAAFCTGGNYPVWYKGLRTEGNSKFKDNQILRLEFDSFKGTLILFIDKVQQPVYFQGIKEKVRFIISMYKAGSSCTIHSLKKLQEPTTQYLRNKKAIKW